MPDVGKIVMECPIASCKKPIRLAARAELRTPASQPFTVLVDVFTEVENKADHEHAVGA